MKLLFRQRIFSWLDSYDIFDESGSSVFSVKGQLDWGHRLNIYDNYGTHLATVKEVILTLLPKFELYMGEKCVGMVHKEFTFFAPRFNIDFNGWKVEGNIFEWDYMVRDGFGNAIAYVSKELWNLTDTYSIDVLDPKNAIYVLMIVLAIDAEKCTRD